MHQTLYIDIDEEITSIVEKLKKARTKEVVIVVPKRALLIQSIVNLRILKKEADDSGLQIMIVTQDKLGKILIEKAGILVQQKMDNISDEEISTYEREGVDWPADSPEAQYDVTESVKTRDRLNRIGSQDYFDEDQFEEQLKKEKKPEREKKIMTDDRQSGEKITNRELVTGIGADISRKKANLDLDVSPRVKSLEMQPRPLAETPKKSNPRYPISTPGFQGIPRSVNQSGFFEQGQDKKIENFFFHQDDPKLKDKQKQKEINKSYRKDLTVSGNIHKWFWSFGVVAFLAVVGIPAYLFLPKATVNILTNSKEKTIDSEIMADVGASEIDVERGIIPAKLVEEEVEITKSFKSTGSKAVSNQKARGTIIIYNEFGSDPQPLVATTRFLTEDGKLFRLVSGVTVPGYTEENGKIKPGQVDAEVAADQAGEEYNIGPSAFTIPGFKSSGGEKYAKIYAKSEKAMNGGGSGTQEANTVTEADVNSAKEAILTELDEAVRNKIKTKSGDGTLILDDAINKGEAIYKLSNSPGEVADSFEITVAVKAQVIAVDGTALKNTVAGMLAKSGGGQISIDGGSVDLDFGKPDPNFKTGMMNIKFHAVGRIKPDLNLDKIKSDILGKNEQDLATYLGAYPDVKAVEVEYQPSFLKGRVPFWGKRVTVVLDSNM